MAGKAWQASSWISVMSSLAAWRRVGMAEILHGKAPDEKGLFPIPAEFSGMAYFPLPIPAETSYAECRRFLTAFREMLFLWRTLHVQS